MARGWIHLRKNVAPVGSKMELRPEGRAVGVLGFPGERTPPHPHSVLAQGDGNWGTWAEAGLASPKLPGVLLDGTEELGVTTLERHGCRTQNPADIPGSSIKRRLFWAGTRCW